MAEARLLLAEEETQAPSGFAGPERRAASAATLGATLYVPATRPNLYEILAGIRFPRLRSVIVCTEDSVSEAELGVALGNVRQAIRRPLSGQILRFLRPRSPGVLAALKACTGFGLFDGVVLPKTTPASLAAFAQVLEDLPSLPILPILETEHVFSISKLEQIATALEELPNPVTAVRIGGNDILNLLGIRRPRGLTAYETPLRDAIVRILAVFRPRGHAVAAAVYEHFRDLDTLRRETCLDVVHGLTTKSAIHPAQVGVIEEAYPPSAGELIEARQIVEASSAVFDLHGSMCEPATHRRWAREVIERAAVFGVREARKAKEGESISL